MWTDAWWLPILAMFVSAFLMVICSGLWTVLVPARARQFLAGLVILTLTIAAAASYAYAIFHAEPLESVVECLGPPYEVC